MCMESLPIEIVSRKIKRTIKKPLTYEEKLAAESLHSVNWKCKPDCIPVPNTCPISWAISYADGKVYCEAPKDGIVKHCKNVSFYAN